MLRVLIITACIASACAPLAEAQGLKGTRVQHHVRLEISSDGKTVKFRVDESRADGRDFDATHQFLVKEPITLTASRFNPLLQAITVTIEDGEDTTHAVVGQLVESLLAVTRNLGAKIPSTDAGRAFTPLLRSANESPENFARMLRDCQRELDDVGKIKRELDQWFTKPEWQTSTIRSTLAKAAEAIAASLRRNESGYLASSEGVKVLDGVIGSSDQPAHASLRAILEQIAERIDSVDTALAKQNPTECEKAALPEYVDIRLTDPHGRYDRLTAVVDGLVSISTSLKPYTDPGRWSTFTPNEVKLKDSIAPTADTLKKVKVAVAVLDYKPDARGVLTAQQAAAGSKEFVVRRFAAWVPEIGVGLTFSRVRPPVYGTAENSAGETVIALAEENERPLRLDPSLMVNFVCGFCGWSSATPMFQIGTSTSTTNPAVFLGGGFRFATTKKGDFAVGGGVMLPFAKGLKADAQLGDVIGGTAELAEKLEWQLVPGTHSYLTLQYKF